MSMNTAPPISFLSLKCIGTHGGKISDKILIPVCIQKNDLNGHTFLHRYRGDRARPWSLWKKARRKTCEKVNYVSTFPESPGNSCSVWTKLFITFDLRPVVSWCPIFCRFNPNTLLCFTVCCSMVMVVWFFRSHTFIRFWLHCLYSGYVTLHT